jgi:hypothetical protein
LEEMACHSGLIVIEIMLATVFGSEAMKTLLVDVS